MEKYVCIYGKFTNIYNFNDDKREFLVKLVEFMNKDKMDYEYKIKLFNDID